MTWRTRNEQDEKVRFIGSWLSGEYSFTELCERYEISRKTGYKLINRYELEGLQAAEAKSHARHHHPNETVYEVKEKIIALKYRYPKWGPRKIRDWLLLNESEGHWPVISTIGEILKRHSLVKPRKYRRHVPPHSAPFLECNKPNAVWSADFKGQFKVGGRYCYPLTITDNYSRFLLLCDGYNRPTFDDTIKGFRKAFIAHGLPEAIKTDNGSPFAGTGIGGLSRLSIWWLKLGIMPERIKAGCPEQNGRHERMHRTLKECTALPAEENFKAQQEKFDKFRNEYNHERPHEGLEGKRPGDVYQRSQRELPNKLKEIYYPEQMDIRKVRSNGEIKCFGKKYYLSELLVGEPVGLEMIDEDRAILHFAKLKIGIIDAREDKIIRL